MKGHTTMKPNLEWQATMYDCECPNGNVLSVGFTVDDKWAAEMQSASRVGDYSIIGDIYDTPEEAMDAAARWWMANVYPKWKKMTSTTGIVTRDAQR